MHIFRCYCLITKSCPTLLLLHWSVIHQAPLSIGFPRQEYWNGLTFAFPGELPGPGIEPKSPVCRQNLYRYITWEVQRVSLMV